MIILKFTEHAKQQFLKLEEGVKSRITDKLKYFKNHPDIFSVLVLMKDSKFTTHRLRIGNFRLILKLVIQEKNYLEFIVVKIGDRKEIYK